MTGVKLGSNIASLTTQRSLTRVSNETGEIYARLSSGLRINRASDDAAGLALSSSLALESRVYTQAIRNLSDGLSAIAIATGALSELTNVQTRILELSEQAANGTFSRTQRSSLQKEADALTEEMNRIVTTTKFNGLSLFSASTGPITLQDGFGSAATLSLDLGSALSDAKAAGTFSTAIYQVASDSTNAWHSSSADLNNDGNVDIIFRDNSALNVILGNGDGSFKAPITVTPFGASLSLPVFTDINKDGRLDLITSESTGMQVRIGNGDGTFGGGASYSTGGYATSGNLNYSDVNQDGIADITFADVSNGTIVVSLGNANGTFKAVQTYTGRGAATSSSVLADINGDGKLDMVASSNTASSDIVILWGNGNGSFSSPSTYTLPGVGTARWVHSADFNRDGLDDLLITRWSNDSAVVLLSNADGSFSIAQTVPGSQIAQMNDFNEDGIVDLILSGYDPEFQVALGNGNGSFSVGVSVTTAITDFHAAGAADLNNDGALDIYGTSYSAPSGVYVALSNSQQDSSFAKTSLYNQSVARQSVSLGQATLEKITAAQGKIGAFESRVEASLSNLRSRQIETRAAAERILSADIAAESARLVRATILQRAAASILASANQVPALALQLLGG